MQNEPFDQLDPIPNPPKPKMPLGKVVLYNFGIMLTYMLFSSLLMDSGPEAGMGVLIVDAFLILAQVGLNMLIGFILVFTEDKKQLGGALMIGALIMGAIGFGSCIGHMALLDGMR
jgi:ABC-type polysaccharide/polyol phosphate export permease